MDIRRLSANDSQAFRDFRAHALTVAPEAFGEALEEHLRQPVETIAARLGAEGDSSFVLGAFEGVQLCGMVGFFHDQRMKRKQKGWIWGMFVDRPWRGSGVGKRLLEEAIARARNIAEIKQIQLSVVVGHDPARRLYLSLGFEPWGVEPRALLVSGRMFDEEHMVLKF
jgi:RimJ/RimL family protein N-acetyltransferase